MNVISFQVTIFTFIFSGSPLGQWLSFNLSAESRGADSIPAVCPGHCMSLSCAVKFPVAILYGVVICNFDEDLLSGYYVKHTNLIVCSINLFIFRNLNIISNNF